VYVYVCEREEEELEEEEEEEESRAEFKRERVQESSREFKRESREFKRVQERESKEQRAEFKGEREKEKHSPHQPLFSSPSPVDLNCCQRTFGSQRVLAVSITLSLCSVCMHVCMCGVSWHHIVLVVLV
jgi:ATPase subunit of ABC transporter with duplicated ATPase domains